HVGLPGVGGACALLWRLIVSIRWGKGGSTTGMPLICNRKIQFEPVLRSTVATLSRSILVGYARPILQSRGGHMMNKLPGALESDIESELVDLDAVSMTELRGLDGAVVERALRHVMQRSAYPRVSRGSSERID